MQIRVGSDEDYPPYEFVDDSGAITGFNVELMRAVARVTGLSVTFVPGSWGEVRRALAHGHVDTVTGMYYSDARARRFHFSVPHSIVYHSMFVREGSGLHGIEDLRGTGVIVIEGDIMHDYVLSLGFKKTVVVAPNHRQAIRMLASGRHDSALLSKLQGLHIVEGERIENVRAVGPLILPQEYCFATLKRNSALAARLDHGLSLLKASGEYKRIRQKWFGVLFQERYGFLVRLAAWILGPVFLLLLASWYWNRSLSAKVRERTEEVRRELMRHRRTLKALCKREAHLSAILASSSEAILSLNPQRRVTDCNPAFVRQFGYRRDEIVGNSISTIHPDRASFEAFGQTVYPEIDAGGAWRGEWRFRHKEGRILPVEMAISVKRRPDGRHDGYVAIMRDLTLRKAAEAERARLAEKLSQARKLEATGTLAGGIAHDFGNILTSLIGYAEMALEDDLEPDNPARHDVEQILIGCHRAKELVDQILTFSRQPVPRLAPLHLTPLVKETLRLLSAGLPDNVRLTYDLACENDRVAVTPAKVYQLLVNLCTNAVQALDGEEGRIGVSMENLGPPRESDDPGKHLPANALRLTVSDDGRGMTPEAMERIFEPYFTTRDRSGGSGLGLAVVHGIVGSLSGTIDVESSPGKGSRFSILLPQAEGGRVGAEGTDSLREGEEGAADLGAPPMGSGETILLVDDAREVMATLRHSLVRLGYGVVAASDPSIARDIIRLAPSRFDLMITDMTASESTDTPLAEGIRKSCPDLPVIVCSEYPAPSGDMPLRGMRPDAILERPLNHHRIAATVKRVMARTRPPEAEERPDSPEHGKE